MAKLSTAVDSFGHNFRRVSVTGDSVWPLCSLLASLRSSDDAPLSADQSTPTPSTLVVVESSIRKFAREDVAVQGGEEPSPAERHLSVLASRGPCMRAPTGSQLGGRSHPSLDQCYLPVSSFIVSYTKTRLCVILGCHAAGNRRHTSHSSSVVSPDTAAELTDDNRLSTLSPHPHTATNYVKHTSSTHCISCRRKL